ncbi:orotidine-5'-phosphate decarboxylase [Floricoccus penangensis]|uniref:orotidine-5'-phosphate decarboxylase n=1 Tax=Floricoccus penangensis TaxID=1859475 RepID=UPI00203BDB73|nr:orotidine-5'-phosphate decarboxylase [Floricoccus penangensis]
METRPVIALDFSSDKEVYDFLEKFQGQRLFVKIGMELFYKYGPEIVKQVAENHDVFLDLKLHDIPNTVERAMANIAELNVALTNVHAAGGVEMMEAALRGLEGSNTKLIAVTQLTSTSEEQMHEFQNIQTSLLDSVIHYAKCTEKAGLDGVVCSAKEARAIKDATSEDFICLTPGIRPAGAEVGDQKRVVTPADARKIGSDYIVVGRPITQAENPVEAYENIMEQYNS